MSSASTASAVSPADRRGRPPAAGDLTGLRQPAAQAFRLLQVAFVVAPVLFGLDKFLNLLTDWTQYLAPVIPRLLGVGAQTFMYGVGAVAALFRRLGRQLAARDAHRFAGSAGRATHRRH